MDKIEFIEFRFADILGRLKAMTVPCRPVATLGEVRKDPALERGTSLDGSSIAGLSSVEASDLRLIADPDSLVELPYTVPRRAAVMCFVDRKVRDIESNRKYYSRDCRGVLHGFCERQLGEERELRVKIEPEFYFVADSRRPLDDAQYADAHPVSSNAELLLELAHVIRGMGLEPHVIHHEVGHGQQEIEIQHAEARRMADAFLTFKNAAHALARKHGIGVTFMPKPFPQEAGSGLHCHLQLWEEDKNLFGAGGRELSETARMFVAGLLEHAPAITAIANPTINSYKRLVPHYEAPVYITWGALNRTALVRVPLFEGAKKAALEYRASDATANPYMLFTALLASGLDGIERGLTPPEPRKENIFEMDEREREKLGIKVLPESLIAALDALRRDTVIRKALGRDIVEAFLELKTEEWERYIKYAVTDWEWEAYEDL